MDIPEELLRILMEVGYLAGGHGLTEQSRTIFNGIRAVREDSEYPLIGLAVTELNAGNYQEAVRLLEEAKEKSPDNYLSWSFLGLAYKLMGESTRARSVLEEVVKQAQQKEARDMAQALLEEL